MLQLSIVIGVLIFFFTVVLLIRKGALTLKYSLLWLFFATIMLVIGIFPGILNALAMLFGFVVASNALFVLLLGFTIVILLSITSIVSKQSKRIRTLVQTNALLEKRIRKIENNIHIGD